MASHTDDPLVPDLGTTWGRAFGRAHRGCVNRPKVSSATEVACRAGRPADRAASVSTRLLGTTPSRGHDLTGPGPRGTHGWRSGGRRGDRTPDHLVVSEVLYR